MNREQFYAGAGSAAPICLGIIPVGISYGLLAMQAGLSRLQTVLMSVLVMAGSSQLMAVGMLGSATILSILTAVFFVNLRHIVMSSSVMCRFEHTSLREKLLCAFALCDESFALFSLSGSQSAAQLLGANTALYGTWVVSSAAGCVLGQFLPEVVAKGFSIAFYAAFLAMLIPNAAKSSRIALLVLLAAGINTVLRLFLPVSWAVILSMVVSAAIGTCFVEAESGAQV